MALPSGTYLIRANPAAAILSFHELAAYLSLAVRVLSTRGQAPLVQAQAQKPVTSDSERPTLEGP